jgi:hypothetical protein
MKFLFSLLQVSLVFTPMQKFLITIVQERLFGLTFSACKLPVVDHLEESIEKSKLL